MTDWPFPLTKDEWEESRRNWPTKEEWEQSMSEVPAEIRKWLVYSPHPTPDEMQDILRLVRESEVFNKGYWTGYEDSSNSAPYDGKPQDPAWIAFMRQSKQLAQPG